MWDNLARFHVGHVDLGLSCLGTPAGVVLPTVSWALTLATNKENALQTSLQACLMGVFSQLKFLVPNDSGLCQVGIKLVSTRVTCKLLK